MSVNATVPATTPSVLTALPADEAPATGWPASTPTVTVWVALLTPLVAVTVKVSVLDPVAAWRWDWVGV